MSNMKVDESTTFHILKDLVNGRVLDDAVGQLPEIAGWLEERGGVLEGVHGYDWSRVVLDSAVRAGHRNRIYRTYRRYDTVTITVPSALQPRAGIEDDRGRRMLMTSLPSTNVGGLCSMRPRATCQGSLPTPRVERELEEGEEKKVSNHIRPAKNALNATLPLTSWTSMSSAGVEPRTRASRYCASGQQHRSREDVGAAVENGPVDGSVSLKVTCTVPLNLAVANEVFATKDLAQQQLWQMRQWGQTRILGLLLGRQDKLYKLVLGLDGVHKLYCSLEIFVQT
ncbi:hypothetical protein DFJ58DRAFT_836915 [Suillus subalutaceus]|uniref:uncharacterized protein n=1 Tax=Suillus subalutaceus TaxID=48586 RepID=UPI001B85B91F|nr:uncharacterized protein DFJ58DRAFT_836915 [Suillus subalutaceus]KAG1872350.1 hypothetical protein DFJ58DRAFT_836915 [Suillus subalutaceus]